MCFLFLLSILQQLCEVATVMIPLFTEEEAWVWREKWLARDHGVNVQGGDSRADCLMLKYSPSLTYVIGIQNKEGRIGLRRHFL